MLDVELSIIVIFYRERKEKLEKLKNEYELRSNKSRLMDKTLNVKTVLQHLELSKYLDIFNQEEVSC